MRFKIERQWNIRRWLPQALAVILALPPMAGAQAPARPIAQGETMLSLKVIPLAGNRESNDLERRIMAPLVVQVLNQNSRPVEGAEVVFRFPVKGPGAIFANEQTSQTVRTNADGQAAAVGWTANKQVGTFLVQVSASRGNEIGDVSISMTNVARVVGDGREKRKSWWSSKWAKIGVIGGVAGAVAAVILLTRDSNGTPTITASPGSPTIGGPQ